jgi:putative ABC transport system ATP-binding protein
LSHAFGDGSTKKTVLDGITVNFYPGEIVILMGPSGAGKTTLLSLIGALRTVQTGSVNVAGTELNHASACQLRAVRRRVGYVFQDQNLLPSLTACENVQLALATESDAASKASRSKAIELLSLVGLRECAGKLPRELSGGQKQRVAIARALVRSPKIILADEPTAALDGHSGRVIVELLQHLARQIGCAVLLVTHDTRILDVADRLLMLEDGRMDKTNLGLNRATHETFVLMKLLAGYPAAFTSPQQIGAISEQFDAGLHGLLEAVATTARRGDTSGRTMGWLTIAENLSSLRNCLDQVSHCVLRRPPDAASYAEALRRRLDFLFLTAAQTFEKPAVASLELLLHLTGENGPCMTSIRDEYLNSREALTPEAGRFIFDLAGILSRTTYFLHKIAKEFQSLC